MKKWIALLLTLALLLCGCSVEIVLVPDEPFRRSPPQPKRTPLPRGF